MWEEKRIWRGPPAGWAPGSPLSEGSRMTEHYCIVYHYLIQGNAEGRVFLLKRNHLCMNIKALRWEWFNAAIKSRTFAEDPDIRSRHIETRTKLSGINQNTEGPVRVGRIYLTWPSLQLFGETVVMWRTGVGFCLRLPLANNGFGVTMQSFHLNAIWGDVSPSPVCKAAFMAPPHTQKGLMLCCVNGSIPQDILRHASTLKTTNSAKTVDRNQG